MLFRSEACLRQTEEKERFIRVFIGVLKEQLYISVSNSVEGGIKKSDKAYFSVKPQSAAAAVGRMQEELLSLKEKAAHLEEADFAHTAERYRDAGNVLHITGKLDSDGARRLCDTIARAAGGRCAVFAGSDGAYQYAVIESGGDLRPLVKDMNAALHEIGRAHV